LGQPGPQHPRLPSKAGRQSESVEQLFSLAEIATEWAVVEEQAPEVTNRATSTRALRENAGFGMRFRFASGEPAEFIDGPLLAGRLVAEY
jgi:hypothetical protein